tara:strand:- start:3892 stop:4728 length:837 start_codon:yes stop_codon:yes gene_type:complete
MTRITYLLALCLLTVYGQSQNIGGTATYKTATSLDLKIEGDQMSPEQKKMMEANIAKATQKEYELDFNRNESIYEEVVELEKEGQGGMRMLAMFTGGSGTYYKNLQEQRYTEQTEFFGKMFLIQDSLENLDWTIGKETKSIGNYICQKATAMRIREAKQLTGDSKEGLRDSTIIDTVQIVAWFTMQIPISHGPARFYGLPGLILEVNDGNTTILCTKVSINTKEPVEIKEPSEGEEVDAQEYQEITARKIEEMQQNFGNGPGGRGGGHRGSFQVTIGR